MYPSPPLLAHAQPCLSTGWALNRRFEEILGPLFLWSKMEDWVFVERLYREREERGAQCKDSPYKYSPLTEQWQVLFPYSFGILVLLWHGGGAFFIFRLFVLCLHNAVHSYIVPFSSNPPSPIFPYLSIFSPSFPIC